MPETRTIGPGDVSAAERDARHLNECFDLPRTSPAATTAEPWCTSLSRPQPLIYTLADSNESEWIATHFRVVEVRSISLKHELVDRAAHPLLRANVTERLTAGEAPPAAKEVVAPEGPQTLPPVAGRNDALGLRGQHAEDSRLPMSAEQWIAELRAWIASHPRLPYEADDSRESIYEGRGE